jgi:predicted dehydrogenase
MNSVYNVLIIGAGAIGAFYDSPDSENILTHAHAFTAHNGFLLVGFVDKNPEQALRAVQIWGGTIFDSIDEAFAHQKVDIVCICTSDESHYEYLKKVSSFPVKLVFAEKPITKTLSEAEEIYEIYSKKNIPVCVNYRRSFVPEIEQLKIKFKDGIYGHYLTGTGYYGKGFLHNGSHMIHLLQYFFNEIKYSNTTACEIDYYSNDPSLSAIFKISGSNPFYLQHVNCNYYTIFEADFIFEKARIRITDTGLKIEEYIVRESDVYAGYRFIEKTVEKSTLLTRSLFLSADNIYNHLSKGEPLKCDLDDALSIMKICSEVKY